MAKGFSGTFLKRYPETIVIPIMQTGAEGRIAFRACIFFTPFQSKWRIFEFYQMVYLELLSPLGLLGYFLRVSVSTYREGCRGQDVCFSARNGLGRHRRNAERRENCRRIEIGIRPSEWIKESCFL